VNVAQNFGSCHSCFHKFRQQDVNVSFQCVSMACKASRKVPFFIPNALALANFLNRVSVMDPSEEYYSIPNHLEKRGYKARMWNNFQKTLLTNNGDFFHHMPQGSHAITEKV
jgi:hypothetical protein